MESVDEESFSSRFDGGTNKTLGDNVFDKDGTRGEEDSDVLKTFCEESGNNGLAKESNFFFFFYSVFFLKVLAILERIPEVVWCQNIITNFEKSHTEVLLLKN
jgi:hypothetical protein